MAAPATEPVPEPNARAPRNRFVVLIALAVLAVPLVVALVALHEPRWFPLGDIAQTEMRVRDVDSVHAPLIGLPGRIGTYPEQGSHPGPLSFYALWPTYRVLGSSSFALQCASVVLQLGAMAVALWLAWRRGGARMVVAIAAVLAVLAHNLGFDVLVEPWNPYLPVMTWVVFLLAVWSVCCGDVMMLAVGAVAGSFCVQTHISYVAPVGGLGLLAIAATVWHGRRTRDDPVARARTRRAVVLGGATAVVLWVPPLIEQFTSDHGNLTAIWDYFRDPHAGAVGLQRGMELLLAHLDPWGLVAGQHGVDGSLVPGTLLLVAWAASVVLALRAGAPASLRWLHVVLAVALGSQLVAMSRIFGEVFFYLMLWSFATTALMVVATGWSVVVALGRRPVRDAATVALATVTVVFALLFAIDAHDARMPLADLGDGLAGVLPGTERALDRIDADRGGRPYLVTWDDPIALGGRGFAFLSELERAGYDVGATELYRTAVTGHRVVEPPDAALQVHLAVGAAIAQWRAKPGVTEVAHADPRTPAQRAESERLRREVDRDLRARGLGDLVRTIDVSLYSAITNRRMPAADQVKLRRIGDLDLPAAVFLAPPGA